MGNPSQNCQQPSGKQKTVHKLLLLVPLLLACLVLTLLAGCQQGAPSSGEAADKTEPMGDYTGQDLPEQIQGLRGIPLFFISPELSSQVSEQGAYFLLLSPQDPQRAVLVVFQDESPEALASRASERHEVDGAIKEIHNPGLVDFVNDNYEIDLALNDSGNPILLQASRLEVSEVQIEMDEEEDL